jgi:hypothetical protein
MPSTLVHVAMAGLVGTALLGQAFDRRAIAVVAAVTALPDLDAVAGLYLTGAHRALLHTFLFPGLLAVVLAAETRRPESLLRARVGDHGVRVAWVSVVALFVAGLLPDLFTNGVNVLYPVHDAFYTVNGELLVSNQRGVVQTFVDLSPSAPAPTTDQIHYSTVVDPQPGTEPVDVERTVYLVQSGWELLVVLAGVGVVTARLWEEM